METREVMTREEEQQLREQFAALDPERRKEFLRIMREILGPEAEPNRKQN